MAETLFCTMCKNHCPLSNPKCKQVREDQELRERMAKPKEHCNICSKECEYTALECDLGRTMARIRGKITE